ncbi:hypothetical protein [Euzebya tangerina]|uniref:hypothetical protein n=1 Tax=Euzebya tangerina TaxID=591198 RepID=UPI000E31E78D|nr:hypothetical protein [Euzebya tangerina]
MTNDPQAQARQAIRPVKERIEDELLAREGVVGVDIAEKISDGEPTGELSIVVYVEKKKAKSSLTKAQTVPAEVDGVVTDVQEMQIELQPSRELLDEADALVDTGSYTPLIGGISMGPARSVFLSPPDVPAPGNYTFSGTLGALVKDRATGAMMGLTNFHVACVDSGWSVGDRMTQPSRPDGGATPGDEWGQIERAVLSEEVDGAVIKLDAGQTWQAKIAEIGDVAGGMPAAVGMPVQKRGRTTEHTFGTVRSVDFTVTVDYGDGIGPRTLRRQIRIETDTARSARFSNGGDSGSVIMTNDRKIVGLLFAGSTDGTNTFANPLQSVLDELAVDLVTPPPVLRTRPTICWPTRLRPLCPPLTRSIRECFPFTKVPTICYGPPVTRDPVNCWPVTRDPRGCWPVTRDPFGCGGPVTRDPIGCGPVTRGVCQPGDLDPGDLDPGDFGPGQGPGGFGPGGFGDGDYAGGPPPGGDGYWAGYMAALEDVSDIYDEEEDA